MSFSRRIEVYREKLATMTARGFTGRVFSPLIF
jgi:hypothetical protein